MIFPFYIFKTVILAIGADTTPVQQPTQSKVVLVLINKSVDYLPVSSIVLDYTQVLQIYYTTTYRH